jgi:hypothetical protein
VTEQALASTGIPDSDDLPVGAGIDVSAGFHARLGGAMTQMAAVHARNQERAAEVRIVPVILQAPVVGGVVIFANSELGPKTGYVWAVQYAALQGIPAADTGVIGFYIGQPQPQNWRGQFTVGAPTINPGRTDFVLNYGDFVTAQTTTNMSGAATVLTLNMQVAVMETRMLPRFLV